ncbi:MAG: DUF2085 domain-containing protein [Myxococcota bacterium]|jgi:uncharacterized membrane protein|nr:DUF2085 domain-containing protein [Myxococcota bacterium]
MIAGSRRTGGLVWLLLAVADLGWLTLMVAPALMDGSWLAVALREAYAPFCHQDPARAFHLHGSPLAACCRCFAVAAGAGLGLLLAAAAGQIGRTRLQSPWLLAVALMPLAVDAVLGLSGLWANTAVSRTLTGLLAGGLGTIYLLPAATVAAAELRLMGSTNRRLDGRETVDCSEGIA